MKRIIKFRGKSLKTHTWLFGALIPNGDKKAFIVPFGLPLRLESVAPETVCQFTGYHDKNGKEIYEGDAVNAFKSPFPHTVVWDEGEYDIFCPLTNEYETLARAYKHITVIGNIYDNPELQKNSKDLWEK